jgi:predicted aspartyl protease
MDNTQYAGFVAKVVLLFLAVAGTHQSLWAQSELHFRLVNNTLVVISMRSNQAGTFDFVLDTGADTTVVDSTIASRLSLVPVDRIRQSTLSGTRTVTSGFLRNLSGGSVQVENLYVLTQDLSELRKIDVQIQGIVGQNFLSHFNYLIDYRKRVVRFELGNEIQDVVDGEHVPIDPREGLMLVPSDAQAEKSASLQLLLDSAASNLVLLHRAVQALSLSQQESGFVLTINGQVGLRTSRIRLLTVGSRQLRDLVAAIPAIEPPESIGDGMLPTVLFQAVYINNHEHFVVFNPRINGGSPHRLSGCHSRLARFCRPFSSTVRARPGS